MITLEQLEYQLGVLKEDQRKTNEKMWQILGAMKVVEYFINEIAKEKMEVVEKVE